jgi:predicted AlkP superfamily phosphohydrolase/phosphomutase
MTTPSPSTGAGRVAVVGLDGATFSVLDPLLGGLPHLSRLMASGIRAPMASTAHPLSPPAWASIMTGRPPGEHGVFDFVAVDHGQGPPAYTLITSADLRAPTVFDLVADAGGSVTALNFPAMFPAPDLDGFVVPGYVPWSYLPRATHPRSLFKELRAEAGVQPRRLAVDWELERTAIQGLPERELAHWVALHLEREREWFAILTHLMTHHPTDLTAVVLDGGDRILHLCGHLLGTDPDDLGPEGRRVRELTVDYFVLVDGFLGEIERMLGADGRLLVVSDHGSCRAGDRVFFANSWLAEQGLLTWADGVPTCDDGRLAMDGNTEVGTLFDWRRTRAAALTSSSNAIVVHRSRTPGDGGVPAEEHDAFCDRLTDALLALRDPATGEPVVARVMRGRATFPGPYAAEAPDLTLELHQPGFLSVLRGARVTGPRTVPYGTHHPDGILVGHGPGLTPDVEVPAGLSVLDVAPTVLRLLGLDVPSDLPGRAVADDPTRAGRLERVAVGVARPQPAPQRGRDLQVLDPQSEAEVLSRLRMLGYLE